MNQARTGTDNRTFNLVSVLYHSLESAATNEKYLRDAQGDRECEEFFREIEEQDRQRADRAKMLLGRHLQGGQTHRAQGAGAGAQAGHAGSKPGTLD